MVEVPCGWHGCGNGAEASLEGRQLCRSHFYDLAAKRLDEHRAVLCEGDPMGARRLEILKFLSELISATTILVANARFLGQEQRDKYLELTLLATQLYKRVQRPPRLARKMPILIRSETDSAGTWELTNTLDISKRGASVATVRAWKTEERIWIRKPQTRQQALARVAWLRESAPSAFLIGLEILECEDFWELERSAPKNVPLPRDGKESSMS